MVRKEIDVRYVSMHDQVADIFNKGLNLATFQKLKAKLMVRKRPMNLRGCINYASNVPMTSLMHGAIQGNSNGNNTDVTSNVWSNLRRSKWPPLMHGEIRDPNDSNNT